MFYNSCSKCSKEFETKNPKRIICPDCLYPSQGAGGADDGSVESPAYGQRSTTTFRPPQPQSGGYGERPQGGGYRPQGGGGFRGGPGGPGGFRGGPGGRPSGGGFRGGPPREQRIFIPPDLMYEIERRYKEALPLPNPDVHDVWAEDLKTHPKKIFYAINLIRQKYKLPKIEFPRRPLAVTPDQLQAVQALYEPYLPESPIGVHKIISKQLRMDEWRVHVAIKLVRKSRNLPQWNEDRPDLPEHMKKALEDAMKVDVSKELAEAHEATRLAKEANAQGLSRVASKPATETVKTTEAAVEALDAPVAEVIVEVKPKKVAVVTPGVTKIKLGDLPASSTEEEEEDEDALEEVAAPKAKKKAPAAKAEKIVTPIVTPEVEDTLEETPKKKTVAASKGKKKDVALLVETEATAELEKVPSSVATLEPPVFVEETAQEALPLAVDKPKRGRPKKQA
jgi:hypothetical protein